MPCRVCAFAVNHKHPDDLPRLGRGRPSQQAQADRAEVRAHNKSYWKALSGPASQAAGTSSSAEMGPSNDGPTAPTTTVKDLERVIIQLSKGRCTCVECAGAFVCVSPCPTGQLCSAIPPLHDCATTVTHPRAVMWPVWAPIFPFVSV